MDRGPPLPSLFEQGMPPPPQPLTYLPSPVTPSQDRRRSMDEKRWYLKILDDQMIQDYERIQQMEVQHQQDIHRISGQSLEIQDLMKDRARMYTLQQENDLLTLEKDDHIFSGNQKLQELDQHHRDELVRAVENATSQAMQNLSETRREMAELNDTSERDRANYEKELDAGRTKNISLDEDSAEARITISRLEATCKEFKESSEASINIVATQTASLALLETKLAVANEASDKAYAKLQCDIESWENKLAQAETRASKLLEDKEHLASQRNIERSNRERAEAAQDAAEGEAAELKKQASDLREKNLRLETANKVANESREEMDGNLQKHADDGKELLELRRAKEALTNSAESIQKHLIEQGRELAATKTLLEQCSIGTNDLRLKNEILVVETEEHKRQSSELRGRLKDTKFAFDAAESKRQKESMQVEHLNGKLVAVNKLHEATKKSLASAKQDLELTKAALSKERKQHQMSRNEISGAEVNAAKHLQAKEEAEANLEKINRQLNDRFAHYRSLEQQLLTSRKHPQRLMQDLKETRNVLRLRSSHLEEMKVRQAQLEKESRASKQQQAQSEQDLRKLQMQVEQVHGQLGEFVSTPAEKRAHDSVSRDSGCGSDDGQSPRKEPRVGDNSSVGASRPGRDRLPSYRAFKVVKRP